jgi:hypothetical protein
MRHPKCVAIGPAGIVFSADSSVSQLLMIALQILYRSRRRILNVHDSGIRVRSPNLNGNEGQLRQWRIFLELSQKYGILLKCIYIKFNIMAIEMKIQVCEV